MSRITGNSFYSIPITLLPTSLIKILTLIKIFPNCLVPVMLIACKKILRKTYFKLGSVNPTIKEALDHDSVKKILTGYHKQRLTKNPNFQFGVPLIFSNQEKSSIVIYEIEIKK